MGYNLYITRNQAWYEVPPEKEISLREWVAYVNSDPEMRLDNYAAAAVPGEGTLIVEGAGIAVWTAYSQNGVDGNQAWIWHLEGNIEAKNPDNEIIAKMLRIAETLQAIVVGEECEQYHIEADGGIGFKRYPPMHNSRRPWWRFW